MYQLKYRNCSLTSAQVIESEGLFDSTDITEDSSDDFATASQKPSPEYTICIQQGKTFSASLPLIHANPITDDTQLYGAFGANATNIIEIYSSGAVYVFDTNEWVLAASSGKNYNAIFTPLNASYLINFSE